MMFTYGSVTKSKQHKAIDEFTQLYGAQWMDAIVSVAFEYQVDSPKDDKVGNYFIDIVKEFSERPLTLECYSSMVKKAYRISMEILHSLMRKYSECRLMTIDDHYECTVLLMYLEFLLKDL